MEKFLMILLVAACVQTGFGQPSPDTLWTRTYGGSQVDAAYSVQQTSDRGYIVAGTTNSFGAGLYYFYLVKTNSQGDTLWTRTYGGGSTDYAYSVQQTSDGGYIVAGGFFHLVKTNSQGDTLWTRTYGGRAYSVQQTSDGGYIVAGYTTAFGAGSADFYVVRTNSFGDTLWTRTYGGSSYERANSVRQTDDGGYIVAGYTTSSGAGNEDFYVVKTNGQGDTLWTRTYGGSNDDWAYSVQQTAEGGYIAAGSTESFGEGIQDFYVVKMNRQGDTLWTHTYGGGQVDAAYSIQQTSDGGYIVAGYTTSSGAGNADFYLVKTNGSGVPLWVRTYGGSMTDYAFSVQQTVDGGYVEAGWTQSFGAGSVDFWLVKTGPELPRVVISIQLGNSVLNWPPTGALSYNIYGATAPFISGSVLHTTSDTTWTDINTSSRPSPYFYYVTAASP